MAELKPRPGPLAPPGTWVVIPLYNEALVVGSVLDRVLAVCPNVVVVDDGSTDDSFRAARAHPVHVLRHLVNLGQGAALQSGLAFALSRGAEYIVTFDADGQMSEA